MKDLKLDEAIRILTVPDENMVIIPGKILHVTQTYKDGKVVFNNGWFIYDESNAAHTEITWERL